GFDCSNNLCGSDYSRPCRHASEPLILFEIHLRGHFRELPNSRPRDATLAILASCQLIEDEFPEQPPFAPQHELLRKRLRRLKETEPRIRYHADSLERHQRPHDVSEIRRQQER